MRSMIWRVVWKRLIALPFLLLGLATMAFALTRAVSGDPIHGIVHGRQAQNPEYVAMMRERFGLDEPLSVQFLTYLWRLVQGDFGVSFRTRQPVLEDLASRLPATIELVIAALCISAVAGIVLGVIAARYAGGWVDIAIRVTAVTGTALPSFWLSILALFIGSVALGWFPGPGRVDPRLALPAQHTGFLLIDTALALDWPAFRSALHAILLPSLVLAASVTGTITRLVRNAMIEALESDYVLLARAKGASSVRVLWRHALRMSLLAPVTIVAYAFGYLLTGAVLVETIFAWPGLGDYAIASARALDYPAIIGVTIISGTAFIVVNLAADLAYAAIDPRIR